MKGFKLTGLFIVFAVSFFAGCSSSLYARNNVPYVIGAEMVMDESDDFEIAGLDFQFLNKSKKNIEEITLVFCMVDEYGNPVSTGKSNMVIKVGVEISAGEYFEGTISMDKYLYEIPEEPYQIDFLYVSRIVYEDKSVWTDPFGLLVY